MDPRLSRKLGIGPRLCSRSESIVEMPKASIEPEPEGDRILGWVMMAVSRRSEGRCR